MRKFDEIKFDELDDALHDHPGDVKETAKRFCEYMNVPFYYYGESVVNSLNQGMSEWELVAMVYDKFIEGSNTSVSTK